MKKIFFSLLFLIIGILFTYSLSLQELLNVYGYEVNIKSFENTLFINLKTPENSSYKLYEFLIASSKALKFYNDEINNIENKYKYFVFLINGKGLKFNNETIKKVENIIDTDKKLQFLLRNGEVYEQ